MGDPGGDDDFFHDGKFTSFLGPAKRHHGLTFLTSHVFDDSIDYSQFHTKKLFKQEDAAHATDEIPIGVSTQIDLHTKGFLGKSKHMFGGDMQPSSDPITDKSDCPVDETDLSGYGLVHRGKRKFLVQTNLASGCRHNLAVLDGDKPSPRRSSSAPSLGQVAVPAPYHQDVENEEETNFNEYGNARTKHRDPKRDEDHIWFDQVANRCGETFTELKDLKTHEERLNDEFKLQFEHRKKCFGNVHNKSKLKLDYADDPSWRTDHITFIPLGKTDQQHLDDIDLRSHPYDYIKWGRGHGRRKFKVNDHLDQDDDGVECYVSKDGVPMSKIQHKKVDDHLDVDNPALEPSCFFLDPDGKAISFKPRHHVAVKDNVMDLFDVEVQSENANSLAVTGQRRTNEIIRPKSARRFPLKDTFRQPARARSATPPRRLGGSSKDRPKWH